MKNRFIILLTGLALAVGIHRAGAVLPDIVSFNQNGLLVCTNLSPGTVAAVAWAPALNGPWLTNLEGLIAITVPTNGAIQVIVPIRNQGTAFYRVVGIPASDPAASMALIPAGWYTMGDSSGDGIDDAVATNIYVSAFYMDTNLVSYGQWEAVFAFATNNGYSFDNFGSALNNSTNEPVQTVNWYDAVKWCNARSQQARLTPVYYTDPGLSQIYTNGDVNTVYPNWTANGYQLPTEAQWEKAARGGLTGHRFPWGDTISESQANYDGDAGFFSYDLGPSGYNANFDTGAQPFTSPVGSFPPNGYGLFDMAGNVQQWCWDWYDVPYGQPTTNNPTGPAAPAESTPYRIERGGAWKLFALIVRTANRSDGAPNQAGNITGFRCAKNP